MASKKASNALKKDPVYTWAFKSSKPRGGTLITYETRLNEDGKLSCNCPGWIFCKADKDGVKACKHIKRPEVKDEYKGILAKWRSGEKLSVLNEDEVTGDVTRSSAIIETGRQIRYGRVLELEE